MKVSDTDQQQKNDTLPKDIPVGEWRETLCTSPALLVADRGVPPRLLKIFTRFKIKSAYRIANAITRDNFFLSAVQKNEVVSIQKCAVLF